MSPQKWWGVVEDNQEHFLWRYLDVHITQPLAPRLSPPVSIHYKHEELSGARLVV